MFALKGIGLLIAVLHPDPKGRGLRLRHLRSAAFALSVGRQGGQKTGTA